jgi:hypothetical protein
MNDTDSAGARARIRLHLDQGAPWEACDAFGEEVARHPDDAALLYLGALAHARAGAMHDAHAILDTAQQAAGGSPDLLSEILSLRGRLWKDAYHRAPDAGGASEAADRARRGYLAAYALRGDPFPGINAATLSMVCGDRAEAQRLAREVLGSVAAKPAPHDAWDLATAGEAHLLLGETARARERYAAARASAGTDAGSTASMRRQLRLLARVLPGAAEVMAVLPAPDVVAFAGHMIDAPGRTPPRFPAALAPAVQEALRARLAGMRRPVIYASAACGADLLMIEAAQEVGAEVNVVLPFDRGDFVRTSVAVAGDAWIARFDAALARASRVVFATEEAYLGDDALFDFAALLLEGLAALRAAQLETTPSLLCVIDAASSGGLGGTHASFERWARRLGAPQVIDLRALRERADPADDAAAPATSDRAPAYADGPKRTLKTLLFADVAGYSRLHDAQAPLFQTRFLEIVAAEVEAATAKPVDCKTWGDALHAVFESPGDGAEFALRLQARMQAIDWAAAGLSDTSRIRVSLHAGPVYGLHDPIMRRISYFGSSVTRAARIEPVTPPGTVYTSEAFAATLAAAGESEYALEYVGRLQLAKGYGEARIYRLERR